MLKLPLPASRCAAHCAVHVPLPPAPDVPRRFAQSLLRALSLSQDICLSAKQATSMSATRIPLRTAGADKSVGTKSTEREGEVTRRELGTCEGANPREGGEREGGRSGKRVWVSQRECGSTSASQNDTQRMCVHTNVCNACVCILNEYKVCVCTLNVCNACVCILNVYKVCVCILKVGHHPPV